MLQLALHQIRYDHLTADDEIRYAAGELSGPPPALDADACGSDFYPDGPPAVIGLYLLPGETMPCAVWGCAYRRTEASYKRMEEMRAEEAARLEQEYRLLVELEARKILASLAARNLPDFEWPGDLDRVTMPRLRVLVKASGATTAYRDADGFRLALWRWAEDQAKAALTPPPDSRA